MTPHIVNLLRSSWEALVNASGTTTLGFILWTIGAAFLGWATPVAASWFKHRHEKNGGAFRNALANSGSTGLLVVAGLLGFAYAYFVVRTVYNDHQHFVTQNGQLLESNKKLSDEVKSRKHNIATTDPVFSNLIYLLQAFAMYRNAMNGQRCVVMITAPRESTSLASTVAQLSNSVSNCSTFGPMDATANPDVETETVTGMVPDMVVFHADKDDQAANQLYNSLGDQIRLKRSYQLPTQNNYSLPPGVGPVHVVWLQFGTNSKWNSELYSPTK